MGAREIVEIFERVKREPTDMCEHMGVIRDYASQCDRIVELGVFDCTSTWALLAGHPKELTSYDIERRPEVTQVEVAALGSGTNFNFVLANSLEIKLEQIDLLFIDSLHTYEQLRQELALHASKATKYIIMHDTTTFGLVDQSGEGRGLWPAVEEFLAAHSEWSLAERRTNCHGLTVLKKNT